MRVITGSARGRKLITLEGDDVRPTTDIVKEAMFSIIQFEVEGSRVLDLFGGTGAISYEFASRGASMVYCVEMLPLHSNFIRSQAAKFGLKNMTVVRHNVFEFLEICREKFDIVFADPPYALDDLASIPDKVFARNILHPGAYFILEHPKEFDFSSHAYFLKEKKYGNVHFSFFEAPSGQGESSDVPGEVRP
jgi:16S rRNA (guanine(966)-N(2))-methyltransferase RsmD